MKKPSVSYWPGISASMPVVFSGKTAGNGSGSGTSGKTAMGDVISPDEVGAEDADAEGEDEGDDFE